MDNLNARIRIQKAFLSLLETEYLEKISIAQIIEKADVSRTTYYRYYYDQKEILTEIIDNFINSLNESSARIGIPDIFPENNLQYSLNVYMELAGYASNAETLRVLLKSNAAGFLRQRIYHHFSEIFDRWMKAASDKNQELYVNEQDYDFYKRYAFAGNYDIITTWVLEGCKTPIDDIVRFFVKVHVVNSQFITIIKNN